MVTKFGVLGLMAGTLAPTERGPWDASIEKLNEAAAGIRAMESAKDRIEYEIGWTTLVDSLEEFWHRFYEEGKGTFPGFPLWIEDKDRCRKSDEVLVYLTNARHRNQHGRLLLNWSAPSIRICGPGFCGGIGNIAITKEGLYQADVYYAPGSPQVPPISFDPGEPILPSFENRKIHYHPPGMHLGQSVGTRSPLNVSNMGWKYYNGVLCDAFDKFVRGIPIEQK